MKGTIITIGDELLIGQVLNTNSAWLAGELTSIGFSIENHISISDRADQIRRTLDHYLPENDLLIITGGLGPTNDDITKKVLADYFHSGIVVSKDVLTDVETRINGFGSSMNQLNRDQAMVPEKARILRNHHGTAPGMWFEHDKSVVISLPGVPREMKGIFNDYIKISLINRFSLPKLTYRTIMFTGIAESSLAGKLKEWESLLPGDISVAYLPSPGQIRLRLGTKGSDRTAVSARLEKEIESLNRIAPNYIFGYDDESLESVLGGMIEKRGGSISVAESCTGGTIASHITSVPGCSAWFRGGVVAYSNEIKSAVLGVSPETLKNHGAVSCPTVEEMVIGSLKVFSTDYAIATSGIAGPDGGTPEKPVGTVWIAIAGPNFLKTEKFIFGRDRNLNIMRSSSAAVNMMRKALLEQN